MSALGLTRTPFTNNRSRTVHEHRSRTTLPNRSRTTVHEPFTNTRSRTPFTNRSRTVHEHPFTNTVHEPFTNRSRTVHEHGVGCRMYGGRRQGPSGPAARPGPLWCVGPAARPIRGGGKGHKYDICLASPPLPNKFPFARVCLFGLANPNGPSRAAGARPCW